MGNIINKFRHRCYMSVYNIRKLKYGGKIDRYNNKLNNMSSDVLLHIIDYLSLNDIKRLRLVIDLSNVMIYYKDITIYHDDNINITNPNSNDKDCSTDILDVVMVYNNPIHYNRPLITYSSPVTIYNHNILSLMAFKDVTLDKHLDCKELCNARYLTHVELQSMNINIIQYVQLKNLYLSQITSFNCGFNKHINDNIINQMPNLTRLNCGYSEQITFASLLSLTKLIQLNCGRAEYISDISLMQLTGLVKLNCGVSSYVTDVSLKCLTNLTSLNYGLHTSFTNVSLKCLINLTELCCKYNKYITDESLMRLTKLVKLNCGNNRNFTDISLQHLPNLMILHCGHNNNFTDVGLGYVTNLTQLHCEYNTKFTDESLQHLTKLVILHSGINDNFTYNSLKYLTSLTRLSHRI